MQYKGWKYFLQRAEQGTPLTVVYIGGSVTWGATASNPQETSWRALTGHWLRERFSKSSFRFVDAAIGGTGSELGVFRTPRDVIRFDPDLVFVEFSINDSEMLPEETQRTYEGIIRMLLKSNPSVTIVPVILGGYENNVFGSPVGNAHVELGNYYQLPIVDIRPRMNQVIQEHGLVITDFFSDSIHPNDFGYQLYTQAVTEILRAYTETPPDTLDSLPPPMRSAQFETATVANPASVPISEEWEVLLPANVGPWFDGVPSRFLDKLVQSDMPNATYTFSFEGTAVGLFFQSSAHGGIAAVQVDQEASREIDTYSGFQENDHLLYQLLAKDLAVGWHTIAVKVTGNKNPKSQGATIKIGGLLVNGPVTTK